VLVEGPTVQWAAGYGIADDSGVAVTPRTVFRVGTLAEPVIALALHRLSVERAWNVESPVVTWAHAETIPAGLESASAADMLAHATSMPARSYALLQQLVEMSEGHDLQVLIRAMVIRPHHLTSMSFMPLASGGMARGFDRSGQPVPQAPVDDDDVSSALFSSASDYARFLVEASPLSRRDPATWRRLVRPHRALADDHSLAWGLGWIVARARDNSPIVFRTGEAPGYTSFALVDETRRRALVILTNGDGGLDLTEDVLGFLDPWSDPVVAAYLHGD
jgi:CubicO group peptidase (beta-lactamase class C family)